MFYISLEEGGKRASGGRQNGPVFGPLAYAQEELDIEGAKFWRLKIVGDPVPSFMRSRTCLRYKGKSVYYDGLYYRKISFYAGPINAGSDLLHRVQSFDVAKATILVPAPKPKPKSKKPEAQTEPPADFGLATPTASSAASRFTSTAWQNIQEVVQEARRIEEARMQTREASHLTNPAVHRERQRLAGIIASITTTAPLPSTTSTGINWDAVGNDDDDPFADN